MGYTIVYQAKPVLGGEHAFLSCQDNNLAQLFQSSDFCDGGVDRVLNSGFHQSNHLLLPQNMLVCRKKVVSLDMGLVPD